MVTRRSSSLAARPLFLALFVAVSLALYSPTSVDAKRRKKKRSSSPSSSSSPLAESAIADLDVVEQRQKQIKDAMDQIRKQYGGEAKMTTSNMDAAAAGGGGLHPEGSAGTAGFGPDGGLAPKFPVSIHDAILDGDPLLVKASIGEGGESVDKIGQGGQTPLIHAILNGKDEVVEFLLFAGANLTIKEDTGMGPMHAAAFAGRPRSIWMLNAFRMDPNERTKDGWTPIHYAAHSSEPRHTEAVEVLLQIGVPHDQPTPQGHLPVQLAAAKQNQGTVDLLVAWSKDKGKQEAAAKVAAARNKRPEEEEETRKENEEGVGKEEL